MSYAIIRNENYKIHNLAGIYRHNERKNSNYSNKDINRQNSTKNYSIKAPYSTYEKIFKDLKSKNQLEGRVKHNSNIACEYIITASPDFFEGLAEDEIRRYFETAYKFVCGFKNLGEQYVLSAKVHMDESNPHMHLVYIPVVHKTDTKSGKTIEKICCSDFWKGKNSYKYLQDNFYNYMTKAGFSLERGDTEDNKHIKIKDLKRVTNYEMQKYEKEIINLERDIDTESIETLKTEYKRVIRKYNTLAKQYTRVKVINDNTVKSYEREHRKVTELEEENTTLRKGIDYLKNYIQKTFVCVSVLFEFPLERLKSIVNNFVKESDKYDDKSRNNEHDRFKR